MADLLGIGTSGIRVYQRSLATVGNNIANVDTEGYSRQTHETAQDLAPGNGTINLGKGVISDVIKRAYDTFATTSLRSSTSLLEQQDILNTYARKLEDVLGDPGMSLSSAIDRFFASAQELSISPSSVTARENLLNEADAVIQRFKSLSDQFDRLDQDSFGEMEIRVKELNSLSKELVQVNQAMLGAGDVKKQPSGLLDQRDVLLQKMSKLSSITVVEGQSGMVDVYIGNTATGRAIVSEVKSLDVGVRRTEHDPEHAVFVLDPYGKPEGLASLSGGQVGGIQDFRKEALKHGRDDVDDIANAFIEAVNRIQTSGLDAMGEVGLEMFGLKDDSARASGQMQLLITDPDGIATGAQLMIDQHNSVSSLVLNSWNNSNMSELRDNEKSMIALLDGGQKLESVGTGFVIEANKVRDLQLSIDQTQGKVQIFTREGRHVFGSQMTDQEKSILMTSFNGFSGGMATYSSAYLNQIGENSYRDAISLAVEDDLTTLSIDGQMGEDLLVFVTDGSASFEGAWYQPTEALTQTQMMSEVKVGFIDENTYTLTDVETNTVLAKRNYVTGDPIEINGWSATLRNSPVKGDQFTISKNTSPKGDNRNALALAALQNDRTIFHGGGNFSEVYADVINDLGSVVVQSSIARDAQQVLTAEAQEARDSAAAVSLDEEAADLLRFQQAYQANAQIIQTANKLFDAIIALR